MCRWDYYVYEYTTGTGAETFVWAQYAVPALDVERLSWHV